MQASRKYSVERTTSREKALLTEFWSWNQPKKSENRKQLFALSPSWRFLSSWNSVDTCNKIFHVFWNIFRQGLVMTLWAFPPKNHLWEGFFGSTVWNTYFWVLGGGDLEPSYHSRGHFKRKKFYHANFKNKAIFSSLAVKIHKLEKNRPHHWNLLTKTLLNWIVLFCTPKKNFLETLQLSSTLILQPHGTFYQRAK